MTTISESKPAGSDGRWSVLAMSTVAFTLLFGVWLMLGVLSVPIQKELKLSESQVDWLAATAILAGALPRMNFGIWADRFGGRKVYLFLLLFCAIPTFFVTRATTYPELIVCALLFGLAGNAFTAGISWNSAWFPANQKGFALGTVGAGNVGASATKLVVILVPTILAFNPRWYGLPSFVPSGWRMVPFLYSILLVLMALGVFLLTPRVDKMPAAGRSLAELLAPMRHARVWRFSLYYVVVFGAYVALSSTLVKFYVANYKLTVHDAAIYASLFIFPASLLRPLGGWLSDVFGPRVVTYAVFIVMSITLAVLCVPNGTYGGVTYAPSVGLFTLLLFIVACGMGIGKASVYKYVPNYFPDDIGAVGGLVGALGALGGFFLPPLTGMIARATGAPRLMLAPLLVLTLISLAWLHVTVMVLKSSERKAAMGRSFVEVFPA